MPISPDSDAAWRIGLEVRKALDTIRCEPINDVNMTNSVINRLIGRIIDIANDDCSSCNKALWDRIGVLEEDAEEMLSAVRDLIDVSDPR